jgi:capsular polysaccharide export protein
MIGARGDSVSIGVLCGGAVRTGGGFVFLQGLASRFFERLGRSLLARGKRVWRINFNGGDRAFWRLPGATDFAGRWEDWPPFLARFLEENTAGHLILFGDCRPLHRMAIPVARAQGLLVHVVEEAYLRPGWITFEEGGVNAYSPLPRDPLWFREAARSLPPWREPPEAPDRFSRRAAEDLRYSAASFFARRRFPHFHTHRPYHPSIEIAGWLRRLALVRGAERRAAAAIADLGRGEGPLFLFPLQLDCDYQIRWHSPFRTLHLAIERVLSSFAAHAPAAARLVVKLHPLDSGIFDWAGIVSQTAAVNGIGDRVVFLEGGDLVGLLALSRGVVTVNSTVGTWALARGVPVKTLGPAVYDLPGLTDSGDLDDFWREPTPPDGGLFDAFRRVLAARAMIPGGFFSEKGLSIAAAAAVARLDERASRPPRAAQAEAFAS